MKKVLITITFCLIGMFFMAFVPAMYHNVPDKEFTSVKAPAPASEPYYLVTLKIKQSTFTLDIGEHIKNKMNAVEITIAVDKRFYNSVKVGQDISKSFKTGSLLFNGDFSKLKVTVVKKQIKK